MRKFISIMTTLVLLVFSVSPAMAAEVSFQYDGEGGGTVEILSIEEGDLISLPSQASVDDVVSAELISYELIAVEENNLNIDLDKASARAVGWDYYTNEISCVNYGPSDKIPLGQNVTFQATFANLGTSQSPKTKARVWLGSSSSTAEIGVFNVVAMDSYPQTGKSYVYKFTFSLSSPAGSHLVGATLNYLNEQTEDDLNNNEASATYTWAASSGSSVDPYAYQIVPASEPIQPGQETAVQFIIANAGDTATQPVPVYVEFLEEHNNHTEGATFTASSIPPGYARGYNVHFTIYQTQYVNFTMVVDRNDQIVDDDRTNNVLTLRHPVADGTLSDWQYGLLDFHYPLPPECTGYYWYESYQGTHPGNGMDLNASESTPIYSVDSGIVLEAAASLDKSRGYWVTIQNDTLDPYNGKHIITRYLHMYQLPSVRDGQNVDKGETLGGVGKTGTFVGNEAVNHLHIDFNSNGEYFSGVTHASGIWTAKFFPNIEFHIDNLPKSVLLNIFEQPEENLFEKGQHVSATLIDLIGGQKVYESWIEEHEGEVLTVYQLIEDFGLTNEELESSLAPNIWELYLQYWPE